MKYINADKLKAEIERQLEKYDPHYTSAGSELKKLLSFIDSLQQEQPEVDLEKEIERFLNSEESTSHTNAGGYDVAFKDSVKIARHFYELGFNARKDK